MIATTAASHYDQGEQHFRILGRGGLAQANIEHPTNYAPMGGRFKPNRLHPALRAIQASALRDRPFRQMRIERARGDIWRFDQFRSREFLGL